MISLLRWAAAFLREPFDLKPGELGDLFAAGTLWLNGIFGLGAILWAIFK